MTYNIDRIYGTIDCVLKYFVLKAIYETIYLGKFSKVSYHNHPFTFCKIQIDNSKPNKLQIKYMSLNQSKTFFILQNDQEIQSLI